VRYSGFGVGNAIILTPSGVFANSFYANGGNVYTNNFVGNSVVSSSFVYFSEQIELLASNIKLKTSNTDRLILNNTAANFTVPIISNGNVTGNYFIGNGSQLTGIDTTIIQNGSANVRTFANANVTISADGNANVLVVTGTGANINGTANVTGNISANNASFTEWANANNITVTANISANNANITSNISANNANITNDVVANNANITGNISGNYANITNNVSANNASFTEWANANNITVTANISANNASFTEWANANNINVSANLSAGNVKTDNLLYANGVPYDFQQPGGSNTNIQFNDANDFGGSNAFTFNKTSNTVTATGNIIAGNFVPSGNQILIQNASPSFTSNTTQGVIIGTNAYAIAAANRNNGIAIGFAAESVENGIAIGGNTRSSGSGTAIGQNVKNVGGGVVAIGGNIDLQGAGLNDAIIIGHNSAIFNNGNTFSSNVIILNSTGVAINYNPPGPNGAFYVNPIRSSQNDQIVVYNTTTKEVTYTNYPKTVVATVANLTLANTVGKGTRGFVSDANTTTFNAIVGGGGSNNVPVFSDGTNWRVG